MEDVPLVEFMYLVFTRKPPVENYRMRLRSLLLYLYYVFRALTNSLVCWNCTSGLSLVLFQNFELNLIYGAGHWPITILERQRRGGNMHAHVMDSLPKLVSFPRHETGIHESVWNRWFFTIHYYAIHFYTSLSCQQSSKLWTSKTTAKPKKKVSFSLIFHRF